MQFEIKHRFTGAVMFTAEIEADDTTSFSVRLGLAVKLAVKQKANLTGAYLSGAYLRSADLSGANLSGADLTGAYLTGAYLRGANLSGAYLSGANLSGADLTGAYLRGANLSGADLTGANLSGANLYGAYLRSANLYGEKVSRMLAIATRMDGYTFCLFAMEAGPAKIVAGCRFLTIADYAAHVAREYPDTPKARETMRILDYFEDVVRGDGNGEPDGQAIETQKVA